MRRFSRDSRRCVTSVPARTSSYQLVPAGQYCLPIQLARSDIRLVPYQYAGTYQEILGTISSTPMVRRTSQVCKRRGRCPIILKSEHDSIRCTRTARLDTGWVKKKEVLRCASTLPLGFWVTCSLTTFLAYMDAFSVLITKHI